jgi:uncharacterized membrane protein
VDRDVTQLARFCRSKNRRAAKAAAILVVLLAGMQVSGCGGGSGMQQPPPPPPTFTTIDAPGAGTTAPQGTFAIGINAGGAVVGYFIDGTNTIHAFVRDASGGIKTFDAPGARTQTLLGTEAIGINSTGTIAGLFVDQSNVEHSYIRTTDGTITVFDPQGSSFSFATCINDAGTVAGRYDLPLGGAQGYIRSNDGTFSAFVIPEGQLSVAPFVEQINASDAVTGIFINGGVDHGFLLVPPGTLAIIDAPGAGMTVGDGTEALDVNGNGVVVGLIRNGAADGVAVTHSFMRATDGTYTVFDPPQAGANGSLADGVNDSGVIVGSYVDANLVRHGYVRQPDGTFITFDDPNAAQLPVTSVSLGTAPRRINAGGEIVGLYTDANGVRHGFIRQ